MNEHAYEGAACGPQRVVTLSLALDAVLLEYLRAQYAPYAAAISYEDYLAELFAAAITTHYAEAAYAAAGVDDTLP